MTKAFHNINPGDLIRGKEGTSSAGLVFLILDIYQEDAQRWRIPLWDLVEQAPDAFSDIMVVDNVVRFIDFTEFPGDRYEVFHAER